MRITYGPALNTTVDARTYGAVGDGVTNDSAALQAAIDAVAGLDGGTVQLGPYRYALTTGLTINGNVVLRGTGRNHTILVPTAAIDTISCNVNSASKIYDVEIRDLSIMTASDRASGCGIRVGNVGAFLADNVEIANSLGGRLFKGIVVEAATASHFQRVAAIGCASHGVHILCAGAVGGHMFDLTFNRSCNFDSNLGDGIKIEATAASATRMIGGVYVGEASCYNNTGNGINLEATSGALIEHVFCQGTVLDTNGANGFRIENAGTIRRVKLEDVWSSFNTLNGLVAVAATDLRMASGSYIASGQFGIYLYGCQHPAVIGADIQSNSRSASLTYPGVYIAGNTNDALVQGGKFWNTSDVGVWQQPGIQVDAGCTSTVIDRPDTSQLGSSVPRVTNLATGTRVLHDGTITAVKTGAYPVVFGDSLVRCNTTGGGFTVTLPDATLHLDREITVKRTAGANTVTVAATAGTVETTSVTTTPVKHRSDGTNWVAV